MLTLQKFEKLIEAPLNTRSLTLSYIGQKGEHLLSWMTTLKRLDKHEQYRQTKTVLGELIVADMNDEERFLILCNMAALTDRLVAQMHAEYLNNPQNQNLEQKTYMDEVKSLHFLVILAFQGVAFRLYDYLSQEGLPKAAPTKKSWLDKMTGGLSSNVVRNGVNINLIDKPKTMFTLSVYHIIATCYKLLFEYAIAYQKAPECIWKMLNDWYLKASVLGVERVDISKLSDLKACCINHQYLQCCAVSFANFFAYRRPDIINIFKIFGEWADKTKTTFTAQKHHRVFVNLQSAHPPELIGPNASINPYGADAVCLFFDMRELFEYLNALQENDSTLVQKTVFEARLAKMILLAFDREAQSTLFSSKAHNYLVDARLGFGCIFDQMSQGKSFKQIICQSKLPDEYKPKRIFEPTGKQIQATLVRTSESGGKFRLPKQDQAEDVVLSAPFLAVFSLFALKMPQTDSKHPWRLGIIHWVQDEEEGLVVDGKFLGRILSVCGIRLHTHDLRSKDFVQALLVAGDGLNQQTTLILPRYHFKAGDTVILRVEENQTTLRLEQNLLATDNIEQYQIVRLV